MLLQAGRRGTIVVNRYRVLGAHGKLGATAKDYRDGPIMVRCALRPSVLTDVLPTKCIAYVVPSLAAPGGGIPP